MKKLINCYELTINDTNDGVNVCGKYSLYFYDENDAIRYAENYAICGFKLTAKCADASEVIIF